MLDGRAGPARLLPSRPYDMRTPQGAVLAVVLLFSIATVALITYGPLLMNRLHGLDALAIGLILLLESAGLVGRCGGDCWPGAPARGGAVFGGFVAVTAGVGLLAVAMPLGPVALIAICALAQGGGMGAAWAFMVRRTTVLTAAEERDRAVSAIPTVQRLVSRSARR